MLLLLFLALALFKHLLLLSTHLLTSTAKGSIFPFARQFPPQPARAAPAPPRNRATLVSPPGALRSKPFARPAHPIASRCRPGFGRWQAARPPPLPPPLSFAIPVTPAIR